jgi:hypothetical protein
VRGTFGSPCPRAARKGWSRELFEVVDEMKEQTGRIVVGYDGSTQAGSAVE